MKMIRYTTVWILALTALGAVAAEEPLNIGARRELFVDYAVLDRASMTNVELRLQEPRPAEKVLWNDSPWEAGRYSLGLAVWQDGNQYQMHYRGGSFACRAVSDDGIHWTKPNVGRTKFRESTVNNIVKSVPPFIDTRPGVPASERYKGLAPSRGKFYRMVSSNGIDWVGDFSDSNIVYRATQDSYNVQFWSERDQRYILLHRLRLRATTGMRTIGWAYSTDFVTWTNETISIDPHTGSTNMRFSVFDNVGTEAVENLYTPATSPYFRAPHIYVAFPGRLMQEARADTVFLTSRRYGHYDRTFKQSFIRPGIGKDNWYTRSNYALQGVVQTGDTEMSLYVNRQYPTTNWFIQRCVLRLDGFASLHADYESGEAVTRPIVFSGGKLEINYATSAYGQVQVELQDADGKPIPGFALADCKPIIGDEIKRHVAWKNTDVSALSGKPVKMRFVMRDADVFSFKFD